MGPDPRRCSGPTDVGGRREERARTDSGRKIRTPADAGEIRPARLPRVRGSATWAVMLSVFEAPRLNWPDEVHAVARKFSRPIVAAFEFSRLGGCPLMRRPTCVYLIGAGVMRIRLTRTTFPRRSKITAWPLARRHGDPINTPALAFSRGWRWGGMLSYLVGFVKGETLPSKASRGWNIAWHLWRSGRRKAY